MARCGGRGLGSTGFEHRRRQARLCAIGDVAGAIGFSQHALELVLRLVGEGLDVAGRAGEVAELGFGESFDLGGEGLDLDVLDFGLGGDQLLDRELHGGDGVGMVLELGVDPVARRGRGRLPAGEGREIVNLGGAREHVGCRDATAKHGMRKWAYGD